MRCCPLLVIATALAAADAAPAELKLDAQPVRLQAVTELTFGAGRPRAQQSHVELSLAARLPEGMRFVDTGRVELVEAVTDGGAKLLLAPDTTPDIREDDGKALINLTLQAPPPGTRVLQRVVVDAEVTSAQPGSRKAVIKPVKDWIAKRLRLDGYQDAEVEIEDLAAETLTLGMTPSLNRCLEGLVFRNAAGTELPDPDSNDSDENGWHVRHIKLALPADGQIELHLMQGVAKQRLVLTATGIPLGLPGGDAKATLLPTEPLAPDGAATPEAAPVILKPVEGKPGF